MSTLLTILKPQKVPIGKAPNDVKLESQRTFLTFNNDLPRTIESVNRNRERITGKRSNGSKDKAPYKVKELEIIAEALGILNFTGKKEEKARKLLEYIDSQYMFS